MVSYKALTSASTILEVIDDLSLYESEIFSTNGSILYPYDLSTTLTGVIYKDLKDVTDEFDDIRWTIYNSNSGTYEEDLIWNEEHKGINPIIITKDEINGKAIIQFEAYKNLTGIPNDNTLVACSRMSIVDTNDLLATGVKPNNPYIGQVWIDSSTEPATMWMWNGTKWIQLGTVTAMVKNLIRNSAFYSYNYKYFDIVGDTILSFTPTVKVTNNKKWLNLSSETKSDTKRGISQTTEDTETIYINSDYSFQFLVYNNSNDSNSISINIYSINNNKQETLILEDTYNITNSIKSYFVTFKSLSDTTNFRVEIVGINGSSYDFYITELALYNTANMYPWEPSPYDSDIDYDPESIFNALTYNGKIQGIYSMVDSKTGQLQYFFNASYIQSGTLKGDYIDAKNLVVRRDSDNVKTLEIDSHGNISIIAKSFRLSSTNQTIEEFVFDQLNELNPEQLKYLLYQVNKDHEQASYEYEQYYNDENISNIDYDKAWSEFLDEDMLNKVKEENDDLINIKQVKFNADNTVTINSTDDTLDKTFYLGKARLGFAMLGDNGDNDEDLTGAKLKKLLYYTYLAYDESYIELVNDINDLIDEKKSEVKTFESTDISLDNSYTDYSVKNALLYKLFIVCDDYITNKKITIKTTEWADIVVEANKIVEEVGELKEFYQDDTLKGAFESIANETITSDKILNSIVEGVANPDNKEITEKYRESLLEQTAEGFDMSVIDYQNKMQSSFKLASDGIMLDANGSLINMNNESIVLASNNIDLEGYVTFKKLESKDPDDVSVIDGSYIKTDTLDANAIKTGTLSANQITTGILSNQDNTSIFDLDNGTFKLGDKLQYVDGKLSFSNVIIKDSSIEADVSLPDWIQKWDSSKTEISGEEIVSPRAFFGSYEPESISGLTGIMLGIDLASRNTPGQEGLIDAGIVGYYCNEPSFRLNVDGTAQFGRDTDEKKVYIDSDGALHFGRIDGNEIDARNLVIKNNSNSITFKVNDSGDVLISPNTFYLSDSTKTAIKLEDDTIEINADYITSGTMSVGHVNVADGKFIVKDTDNNTTFEITEEGNINIQPNELHVYSTNGSTKYEAISLTNGETNINANAITVGELNGELIKANTIEASSIMIGDAVNGKNNLTKNALFYKCSSQSELENPTEIEDCTLGKGQYNNYYEYEIDYADDILNNTEKVFIQVDLKQFYNVTASKIYFKDKDSKVYYYKIKYSQDNIHWHNYYTEDEDDWLLSVKDDGNLYTLDLNQLGVTARYFRLYLNGNDVDTSPAISSVSAFELYAGGATTCIDANGIITGQITAEKIETSSITTSHINISDNNFSFTNDDKIVFSIDGEADDKSSVTINPDNFILGNTDGDAIVLDNNELSINASYITTGEINASLITTGELDAQIIKAGTITGNQINAKGLVVTNRDDSVNTFVIDSDTGQIIVDGSSFLIKGSDNTNTVEGMIKEYDEHLSSYIKMEDDTITLGKTTEDTNYKTVITSEKLSFMNKNTEVAYISSQKMYISNAEINKTLSIGSKEEAYHKGGFFDFIHRENGHLTLKWRAE